MLVFGFINIFSINATAQIFQNGIEQYKKKKFKKAFEIWEPLATKGDAEAQFFLGMMFHHGLGVVQDTKKAIQWYLLASQQGNKEALFISYLIPAKQGSAQAQINLGNMYAIGQGVNQNLKQAIKWFTLAAKQGITSAQFKLGYIFFYGQGVADYKRAAFWYLLAAQQGNIDAQFNLGNLYQIGLGVEQNFKEAIKWYALAAEQGFAKAQFNLGVMYTNGQGVDQNFKEAVKWYKLAAEQGFAKAQHNLQFFYKNEQGVDLGHDKK